MTQLLQKNMSELHFRIAEQKDIAEIVSLVESAYRGESSRQGWTTEAEFIDGQRTDEQEVFELMNKTDSIFMLCFDSAGLQASVQIEKQQDNAYLGMFAVNPCKQGGGIGSMLLNHVETYAKNEWGIHAMQITVITIRNELISWYLRNGYKSAGIFKRFPYEEPRYGLPKRDDLILEVYEKLL